MAGTSGEIVCDFRCFMYRICPACARALRPGRDVVAITPKQLCAALARRQVTTVLDVRHPLDTLGDARVIPGAQRVRPQELAWGKLPFRREQAIVIYCAMPGETGSRHAARLLRKRGFTAVRCCAEDSPLGRIPRCRWRYIRLKVKNADGNCIAAASIRVRTKPPTHLGTVGRLSRRRPSEWRRSVIAAQHSPVFRMRRKV